MITNLQVDEADKKDKKSEKNSPEQVEKDTNAASEYVSDDSLNESVLEEMINKDGIGPFNSFSQLEHLTENLIRANDQAVTSIVIGNIKEALVQLERVERILEVV